VSDTARPGPRAPTTAPQERAGRVRSTAAAQPATTSNAAKPGQAGSLATDEAPRRTPVQVAVARRGHRRARLVIKHVDPWTVMKITFVVSIVILVVVVIATAIIYAVLGKMGVWDQINNLVSSVAPTTAGDAWQNPLSGSRVIGIVAVVGAINVVLMTALATLGAAIYNLISDLVGGIEVTLSDP
jgi:hypothetical protein